MTSRDAQHQSRPQFLLFFFGASAIATFAKLVLFQARNIGTVGIHAGSGVSVASRAFGHIIGAIQGEIHHWAQSSILGSHLETWSQVLYT